MDKLEKIVAARGGGRLDPSRELVGPAWNLHRLTGGELKTAINRVDAADMVKVDDELRERDRAVAQRDAWDLIDEERRGAKRA